MANDLQQTRYDQLIRRVGGIIGPGSKVAEALPELFPMIDVENVPIELLFLAGWRLGMGHISQNALAANTNLSQLFNPVGSGQFVIPTTVMISSSATTNIGYVVTEVALTTPVANPEQRDTRIGVNENTVGQVRSVQQVSVPTSVGQFRVLADETFVLQEGSGLFVLAPGSGVTFFNITVNLALRSNFLWRERIALESELLFP